MGWLRGCCYQGWSRVGAGSDPSSSALRLCGAVRSPGLSVCPAPAFQPHSYDPGAPQFPFLCRAEIPGLLTSASNIPLSLKRHFFPQLFRRIFLRDFPEPRSFSWTAPSGLLTAPPRLSGTPNVTRFSVPNCATARRIFNCSFFIFSNLISVKFSEVFG